MLTKGEFKEKVLQYNRAFRKLSVGCEEIDNFRGGVGKWLLLLAKAAKSVNEMTKEEITKDVQELYYKGIIYRDRCCTGNNVSLYVNCAEVCQEYELLRTGRLNEFLEREGVFERNKTLKKAVLAMKFYHPLYWCTCINKWDDNMLKEAGIDKIDERLKKVYEYVFFELQSRTWAKVEECLLKNKKSLRYLIKNYYDLIMDNWFFITGEYGTGCTEEVFDRYVERMWEIYQKISDK